jgi:type IV secretion system protein TrbG
MTPTALEAVRLSQHWAQEKNIPAPGPDGRVIYSFGAGPVTVVCAPLRVCTMELQSGERIQGDPQIGDAVRWNISLASFGVAEESTPVIVLKPQQPGLDTTLLITTDRRAYYARLISQSDAYVERVGFAYAENDTAKWRTQVSAQNVSLKSRSELPALIAVEKMHFDYRIKGGSENIRPVRVFDDGAKTYIQMPQEMQHREAPVLVVVGADGKGQMVNYRVNDQTYVVDRIFDSAELVLGSGKKARKV